MHPLLSRHILATMLALSMATASGARDPADPEPTRDQIQHWVRQLDSNRFIDRELATENLIEVGMAAIGPVSEAAQGNSLEVATRAILVLRESALSADSRTESAATESLQHLAARNGTAASRRALRALAELKLLWQERSLKEIQRLGGKLNANHVMVGVQTVEAVHSLEIGPDWKGGEEGLVHLNFLEDLQRLTLIGPQVNDHWLAIVATMKNLQLISLKRTQITDGGLAHLKDLNLLHQVDLWYAPITDGAVDHLAGLKAAQKLSIYGTQITNQGVSRLRNAMQGVTIDFRRGAFLGIGCNDNHPNGCQITVVRAKSSAARSDIRVGDVIVKYDGKPVAGFKALTEMISNDSGGDQIQMEILRGTDTLAKEVTLGEWE